MDLNSLRNMAGLPPLTENFSGFEKLQAKDIDSMQLNADLPSAGPALISQYKGSEDVFMMLAVDPDEKKIRVAIENPRRGPTHVKYFANDKAGYDDAVKYATQLRTVKPNVSEQAVSEEAMVPSIEFRNEDNVMKACIVLAKEGMTVDLEYAMDVFYFNFKTKQARDKAAKLVKYLLDKETVQEGKSDPAFNGYETEYYTKKGGGSIVVFYDEEFDLWRAIETNAEGETGNYKDFEGNSEKSKAAAHAWAAARGTKDVKEAIVEGFDSFSETHYESANGRKPRGPGSWMFAAEKNIDMRKAKKDVDYFQSPPNTQYSAAKKMALAWAKKNGITSISVLS